MPTYDYKCTNCGYSYEVFQPMSSEPLKECPKCKGILKRLIGTGSGPIFKGSGFYQTDYKNAVKQGDKKDSEKEVKKDASKPAGKEVTAENKKEVKKDSAKDEKM